VFNISKIQIESNSQPCPRCWVSRYCCVQYFKDTNREQFTTQAKYLNQIPWLCSIFQRYKSRAIHNTRHLSTSTWPAVFNISKIQIESNSQRYNSGFFCPCGCVQYFKDTNREQFTTIPKACFQRPRLCSIFQRYKSRAIHNFTVHIASMMHAVFNISKIQIESNSQRVLQTDAFSHCCVQYFKDTNREQFTTDNIMFLFPAQLCSIFQRYKSRAIHNVSCILKPCFNAVFNISKIQIESNSQQG